MAKLLAFLRIFGKSYFVHWIKPQKFFIKYHFKNFLLMSEARRFPFKRPGGAQSSAVLELNSFNLII